MMFRLLPAAAMTATALAGMTAGAATVDVYGVVDTGLHYVKADSGDTSVTMDSGISKGSRVGLIGSEDLGRIQNRLQSGDGLQPRRRLLRQHQEPSGESSPPNY